MNPQDTELDHEPNRGAKWVGVGLILVALATLVWAAWDADVRDDPPSVVIPTSLNRAPALREMLPVPDMAAPAAASAVSGAVAVSKPLAPGEVEVCGLGRFQPADKDDAFKTMFEERMRQAREDLLKKMLAAGDEADRASGLFLQAMQRGGAEEAEVNAGRRGEASSVDATAVDALARMAVGSQSPFVYSLALHACDRARGSGACQMLSAEQWARLDPTNAAPWIRVLDRANKEQDASGAANAMYRITQSGMNDSRVMGVAQRSLQQMPADLPAAVKLSLSSESMVQGFSSPSASSALMRYCDTTAVVDANRRQACAGAAEVLTQRSATLFDVAMGTRIGERAGWPAERVQALQDERDAALGQALQTSGEGEKFFGCASVERQQRHIGSIASLGEMGALRRNLQLSTDSVAVQAQRYRDRRGGRATSAASATMP